MRFALALIFAALAGDSLPLCTIWVARAFALEACDRSGIGYLCESESPNSLDGMCLRAAAVSFAINSRLQSAGRAHRSVVPQKASVAFAEHGFQDIALNPLSDRSL